MTECFEDALMVCPKCDGTGRIEPDATGYDGCDLCNYGDGPTGYVLAEEEEEESISED